MAFLDFHFHSEALGKQVAAYVVLPQETSASQIGIEGKKMGEKFPCLYLLHGLSDDYTIWLRRTSIERFAATYGIAVVMPDGARSFYTDMKHGGAYYTYIAEELPRICESFFHISSDPKDRFIAGLSMGGYGAMKIGLKNPERYAAIGALSPVSDIRQPYFPEDMNLIFGDTIPDSEDLFYLASQTDKASSKPRIFMGVGKSDFMYQDTLRLHAYLTALHYDYTFRESEGDHCWAFWDEYIQYVLEWMFA